MDDRLPLVFDITSRTASTLKDSRVVNALIEDGDLVKRPGLIEQVVLPTIAASTGQGIFSWNGYLIAVFGNTIYSIINGVSTALGTLNGSTLPIYFASSAGDSYLVFHNGTTLSYLPYDSATQTIGAKVDPVSGTGVISATIDIAGGYYGVTATVTMTIATPCVVTQTGHGMTAADNGRGVSFTTTGALPTGIVSGTTYQFIYINANTYSLKSTGLAGAAINTAGTQSGVHTVLISPLVTFSGGGGSTQAVGTAVLFNHQVASIVIDSAGIGYTSDPVVAISAPVAGSTASVTPNYTYDGFHAEWQLTSCTIVSGGSGYITAPTMIFTGGTFGLRETKQSEVTLTINASGIVTGYTIVYGATYKVLPSYVIGTPPNITASATANRSSTISGPWAPGLVYLDGAFYILNKETGQLFGSDLNNPTAGGWNALNVVVTNSDPEIMTGIVRHLNYIVAFSLTGTQFWYDNANPSPASPLNVNQSAYLEIGCASGHTIAQAEQTLIWVGTSITEGRSVFVMSGLSPVKVSTRYIDKYLNKADMGLSVGDYTRSYCFKVSGHTMYVLTLMDLNITFIYDLDAGKWYQWTSQSGDTTGTNGTETYFKPIAYNGNVEYSPGIYLQDATNGKIYKLSSETYTDNGEHIYFRAVSPLIDNGSKKRKFYKRAEVVGDQVIGNVLVRKTDDDYTTWSTYRTVSLADKRPVLYQYGEARRRAWEVFCSNDIPIRLNALEIEFGIGEQGQGKD